LTISGLPPRKLVLKVHCIFLLIRNLNTKEALVNGTRMSIKFMRRNAIDCEVLTGTSRNKIILIRLINLSCSGTILPFNFQRIQFPIILAFAMTINKSQGQHSIEEITKPIISLTLKKVSFLRMPLLTHVPI
jgi:ATP-dependent DNA helicase PIF1